MQRELTQGLGVSTDGALEPAQLLLAAWLRQVICPLWITPPCLQSEDKACFTVRSQGSGSVQRCARAQRDARFPVPFLRGSCAAWNSPQSRRLQTIQRVTGRLDRKPKWAPHKGLPFLSHLQARGSNTISFLIRRGVVQRAPVSMVTGVWPPEASDWVMKGEASLPPTFIRPTELVKGPTEMLPPSHQLGASEPPSLTSAGASGALLCGEHPGFR